MHFEFMVTAVNIISLSVRLGFELDWDQWETQDNVEPLEIIHKVKQMIRCDQIKRP